MKICMFLTNPVTNDPRVRREAASLAKAGYDVVVIGLRKDDQDPSEERLDGYRVVRIAHQGLLARRIRSIKERMLYHLAEISPSFYRLLRFCYRGIGLSPRTHSQLIGEPQPSEPTDASAQAVRHHLWTDVVTIAGALYLNVAFAKQGWRERADVYHAHDLDTLAAAFFASTLSRTQFVYDFHELYTEQFSPGDKSWLWLGWYSLLERLLAKRAHLRLTVCDSLGNWLKDKYHVRSVLTVRNVPTLQTPHPTILKRKTPADRVILYHGLYFKNRGLEQLIKASLYLKHGRIVLRGYGYLEEDLRRLVSHHGLSDRVTFAPPVNMTDLVKNAAEADIGVGAFVPTALNTRFALPNKLFEYMMAGLAVVGTDLPEMRKIILGHQIGRVCKPDDPEDLARTLNELLEQGELLEQMKRNALTAARTVYNWDVEQQVLLKAYEELRAA